MILILLVAALILVALFYATALVRAASKAGELVPKLEGLLLGAVTNFFDTLGIGSFAPTIAWFRFRRIVPDRLIPLTTLAGYILPSILQGLIFLVLLGVQVDPWLMLGCIIAMIFGGLVGVPIAAKAPIRAVQLIVGLALIIAAIFYSLSNLGLMPAGGLATSLPLPFALIAVAVHFLLGILFSFGVGNYAPTLAMLSLMGMNPRLAFPIMASAAGLAGTAAAARSLKLVKLDYRLAMGMAIGAIPAVLVAALLVKEMPLTYLKWLVVVVVTYAGVTLLLSAARRPDLVPGTAAETALLD